MFFHTKKDTLLYSADSMNRDTEDFKIDYGQFYKLNETKDLDKRKDFYDWHPILKINFKFIYDIND